MVWVFVVDLVDRLRERVANRRAGADRAEAGSAAFHVHAPESELRERHYSDRPKVARDRQPNQPGRRID